MADVANMKEQERYRDSSSFADKKLDKPISREYRAKPHLASIKALYKFLSNM
jgi:hypothetical protein